MYIIGVVPTLSGLIAIVVLLPLTLLVSSKQESLTEKSREFSDKRIDTINEIIKGNLSRSPALVLCNLIDLTLPSFSYYPNRDKDNQTIRLGNSLPTAS